MRQYQLTMSRKMSRTTKAGKVFRAHRLQFFVLIPQLVPGHHPKLEDRWAIIGDAGMVTQQRWFPGNGLRALLTDIGAAGGLTFGPKVPQHVMKELQP